MIRDGPLETAVLQGKITTADHSIRAVDSFLFPLLLSRGASFLAAEIRNGKFSERPRYFGLVRYGEKIVFSPFEY